jgi:hypothetical protein
MANSIRPPSAGFLPFTLGIAGFLMGGLAAQLGYMAIYALSHPPGVEVPGIGGEYAAPYGLVGALLGLILGVWGGLRLGKRRGRKEGSPPGEAGTSGISS